jgi:chromosome segregation ATPase
MVLWLAFATSLAAVVAATIDVVVRGVRLWRASKATGAEFSRELDRISSAAEEIQEHLDAAEASGARLREANERLRRSRAQLDVQLQAVREARATLKRLVPFLPPR